MIKSLKINQTINELIISFNGFKPQDRDDTLKITILGTQFPYMQWGKSGQRSFSFQSSLFSSHCDIISFPSPTFIDHIHVSMPSAHFIHASHSLTNTIKPAHIPSHGQFVNTVLKPLSQKRIHHKRANDLCSPTSIANVINHLTGSMNVKPALHCHEVYDDTFDIYGNWVLNVAFASHWLGPDWHCCVERISSFKRLFDVLSIGGGVIVSVKGELKGAPIVYDRGHLMMIHGIDFNRGVIYCIDSAFDTNEKTQKIYSIEDFITPFFHNGNLAYLFIPKNFRKNIL